MTEQGAAGEAERPADGGWDHGAFALAYREHHRAVYAVARRLASAPGAEDLTQEVFLQLWRRPERYDPARGSMRTFLLTVTHSLAVDTLRSDSSRRAREDRDSARACPPPADEPERLLVIADSRRTVEQALTCLPEDQRLAIVTSYYGGCTYREAALALGVPEGTVKSRIRRGLRSLHAELEHTDDAPDAGRAPQLSNPPGPDAVAASSPRPAPARRPTSLPC